MGRPNVSSSSGLVENDSRMLSSSTALIRDREYKQASVRDTVNGQATKINLLNGPRSLR